MNERKAKILKWSARLLMLACSIFLILSGPLPQWMLEFALPSDEFIANREFLPAWGLRIMPHASPLAFFNAVIAQRLWFAEIAWSFGASALVVLAIFKGRFFCDWICPVGTMYRLASLKSLNKNILKVRIAGYIFWTMLFSSLAGFPLLLAFDPLSKFSRLGIMFKLSFTIGASIPAMILLVFLALSFIQPMIWCSHVCPLGYFFSIIKLKGSSIKHRFSRNRREIITGIIAGLAAAFVLPRISARDKNEEFPVLPPGAGSISEFSTLCIRCYACVNACPTGILNVPLPQNANIAEWFLPDMNPTRGVCEQDCNKCVQACPTGAIKHLSMMEKQHCQIGIAEIRRSACLAWTDNQYCMVCDEYCPYQAIEEDKSTGGLPRPVVKADVCRGCGACQNECPAKRDGVAIVIKGVLRQTQIA